jgi:DNA-binding LytR/AlgR family response regulator
MGADSKKITPVQRNRILIVEDEVLIADTLERHLLNKDYVISGKAISYAEAVRAYQREKPDLALLDIRLNGPESGIDFGHFLRRQAESIPFVYLTSQLDRQYVEQAKQTFPAAFLYKPIRQESLYTTIEVALYNEHYQQPETEKITIRSREANHQVTVADIRYLQSDHVYVRVHLKDGKELVQRSSLQELLDRLPAERFVQTHRSYAVNIAYLRRWDAKYVYLDQHAVPLSRSRREKVSALLDTSTFQGESR